MAHRLRILLALVAVLWACSPPESLGCGWLARLRGRCCCRYRPGGTRDACDFTSEIRGGRSDTELKRIRALLVVDTKAEFPDGKTIADWIPDVEQYKQSFIEGYLGLAFETEQDRNARLEVELLAGDKASPQDVFSHYQQLSVEPSDCLFFFYIGHGACDPRRGHYLDMSQGQLLRNELRAAITAKQPGLAIIVTNACSAEAPLAAAAVQRADEALILRTARNLLLMHRGLVDITACKGRQVARGTIFIDQVFAVLNEDLDSNGDGFVHWQEAFPALREGTEEVYLTLPPEVRLEDRQNHGQTAQTPHAFFLPGQQTIAGGP